MSTRDDRGTTSFPPNLEQYLVKEPESFAVNLARAVEEAGKVASSWLAAHERGELHSSTANPFADIVKTLSNLTEYWMKDPSRALEAQTRLFSAYLEVWSNSIQRLSQPEIGEVAKPEKGDKRFQDPEWANNAFFDFLKQAYLVTSRWANELVEHADLDDHTRHKAQFYVGQISHAISPSNFLLTNPELLRETMASNGENLVRGMRMLAEDFQAGGGDLKIRHTEPTHFEIGKHLALTPGKVVARNELAEILQYEPATDTVLKRPLLICPPWINKFYILDLNPQKSFIRWAVEQGHTVFVISWVNPDERHGTKCWEAYIREGLQFALDTIEEETDETEVNAIGYCVGGTLLAAALALFAKEGEERIKSVTFFTTQVDFTHAGDLKVFVDEDQIEALERAMSGKGYLDGTRMAMAFNMLRAGDLIWPYVVNNYLRGKAPLPFDLLFWNSDATRMGAANHSYYLRNCYLNNNLSAGRMELAGKKLSLSDVTIPIYNLAARDDHIAPARSVFEGSKCFGGQMTYVLAGSGHIAGVINPPSALKYQFWTSSASLADFDEWVANAHETAGSWWPHWQNWISGLDERHVPARTPLANGKASLGDAPGEYVMVRA
ncbi:class I poly(R)-hydroxyalkanoic acid synthase [Aquamicrobium zhengzhouense]|uniref:Class I poly(R)-hydroxyalkanoic acid synthase n=1 Tax=Aquamicrobium zhengzhouense TaxID=2781738 RepID=A0ABS0S801_9HYPH|nr:class I poly(R)-hydroxyalkanoic acid synthase [Aquamicrobium zhengzhouense]MBI1619428.1 class I poly(R)-hydroxyalkanoic acid synthase [Aquamicrobium zhengzhouense]